jgi:nucleoside-diphosphate-sugar epimerase
MTPPLQIGKGNGGARHSRIREFVHMNHEQTILITGADGYIGWPTFLKLGKQYPNTRVVGVDNFNRRKWVAEVNGRSVLPIGDMDARMGRAKKCGYPNLEFVEGDLVATDFVKELIQSYRPDVVVHLAAQPSAPYSHMNWEKASYTQSLNVSMTRNLLWALREEKLTDTHYIETTTTGIYGAPNFNIPEGDVLITGDDGRRERLAYPNLASSWYHVSKGFNATNIRLMHFQTKLTVTDIRTSIVFGIETQETSENVEFATRFDYDFYFGTLFNRWCAMAVCEVPLIVYGSGDQIKPFVSLEDAAQSIVNAVNLENDHTYRVFNQLTLHNRIKDMAQIICHSAAEALGRKGKVAFIPNPRMEVEHNRYDFANEGFLRLLGREKVQTMEEVIPEVLSRVAKYKSTLKANKDHFMQR